MFCWIKQHVGYDEPFWYCGAWEFGIFDQGWVLAYRRIIKLEGAWPRYSTFHKSTKNEPGAL